MLSAAVYRGMNSTGANMGKKRRDTLARITNDVDFDDEKKLIRLKMDNWLTMFFV